MAWTDPTTRSTNDLITQSIWNTDIVDNLAYLIARPEPNSLTNKSGGQLTAGAVVVADGANDNGFTTTATADSSLVIGVVMETINDNAAGRVATSGVVTVNVQGNVTRGNFLSTSTTAGRAKDAGNGKSAATFAIALTGYAGGGAGTVTALLLPKMNGGTMPANTTFYTSAGSAPAGYSEYTSGQGRVIVGLPASGTNEGTVGTALTNQQDPTHTHTYTMPNHTHTFDYSASTGTSNTAYAPGSSAFHTTITTSTDGSSGTTDSVSHATPYIQLMAIRKN